MKITRRQLRRIILEAFQDDYGGTPYFAQRGGKLGRSRKGNENKKEEAQLYDALSNPMEIVRKEISEMSDEREVSDYLENQARKGYISADDVYGFKQWHLRSGGGMNATDIQDWFELSTPRAGRWLYQPGSADSGFYKSLNEAFWSKKEITSIDDVQTVGDLRKLIASAQGAKRWEQTKGEAGEAVKGAIVDEILGKIPGATAAKSMFDFFKASYDLPDDSRTGTALDYLDVDDDVGAIVDDPIENAFLKTMSSELESMDGDLPLEKVNMTSLLAKYIKDEFNSRTVVGFQEGKNNMKITKKQLKSIILEEYRNIISEARFSELPNYRKSSPVEIHGIVNDPSDHSELRDEIIDLINRSYAYTKAGRNFDYSQPDDLVTNYDLDSMIAWDIDDDPEPDVLRGMKSRGGRMKLTVSGNDGSDAGSSFSIADTEARLRDGNHYAEMSGRSAGANMRNGVPAITDEATVRSLLPGKDIIWYGEHPKKDSIAYAKSKEHGPKNPNGNNGYDGWYSRNVSGTAGVYKLMFGAV